MTTSIFLNQRHGLHAEHNNLDLFVQYLNPQQMTEHHYIYTWGIARLAIVRPEMISDLRSWALYSGPHWKIGNKNWRPRSSFVNQVWFLNLWSGFSGKKISPSLCLSFCKVLCFGGKQTLWISRGGIASKSKSDGILTVVVWWSLWYGRSSTLFELTPISDSDLQT